MKLILDLDTGVDDTLAIAYAVASPEVDLIGVTASYGNVYLEQGAKNALAVLDLFGRSDVPVYLGESHARYADSFVCTSAPIHGDNGLGDAMIAPSSRTPESKSAIDFIIESVETYGNDLVYVPTGPMTNLAAAIERVPAIAKKINVVAMCGALTVVGNVNAWSEANIYQDPDAAQYVLSSGAHIKVIGLDVTMQAVFRSADSDTWRASNTKRGIFLADMTDFYIKAYEYFHPCLNGCGLHDPLAVAVAIDPTLVKTHAMNLCVETEGVTRGRMIGHESGINELVKNADVALELDVDRFLKEFKSRVGSLLV